MVISEVMILTYLEGLIVLTNMVPHLPVVFPPANSAFLYVTPTNGSHGDSSPQIQWPRMGLLRV